MNALGRVCSQSAQVTRELQGRCCPFHSTADLLSQEPCVCKFISNSPSTPDDSHHPKSLGKLGDLRGGQTLKTGLLSMHNCARGSQIRNVPSECLCFLYMKPVILVLEESKLSVFNNLSNPLIWLS